MLRDIGGAADFILMTRDQHAVTRHDEIRFYVVRALLNRQTI
jgi:hypothetical protein